MLTAIKKLLPFGGTADARVEGAVQAVATADAPTRDAMRDLVAHLHYEVVPTKSIDQAIDDLPAGARVSVTCSPTKGIPTTQEYTERLLELGHQPVPHLAARLVDGPVHARQLADWIGRIGLREVFVVAGDAPDAVGPYEGALPFMAELLEGGLDVDKVGITGYPDGHALIDPGLVSEQLHAKQALLDDAGVGGWISTQMCFDEQVIRDWIVRERSAGIELPVRLGMPGVVDRARLMTMGTRLGIGASMRYLSKNRSTVMHLMAPGGFDPTDMVVAFADDADALGVEALHVFTFNAVADTRAWQEAIVNGTAD